jgi:hypothetical protein
MTATAPVQLLRIKGLLSGMQRAEHADYDPDLSVKKAEAEPQSQQKPLI